MSWDDSSRPAGSVLGWTPVSAFDSRAKQRERVLATTQSVSTPIAVLSASPPPSAMNSAPPLRLVRARRRRSKRPRHPVCPYNESGTAARALLRSARGGVPCPMRFRWRTNSRDALLSSRGPLRGSAAQQTVSLGSEARALRRAAARSFTANPGLQRGKGLRCPCVAHLSARYRAVLAKTRLECLIRERTHRGL